jgi:hypothetical protein
MAAIGEPRENGFAERLVRTIKEGNCLPSDGASGSVVGMNWRS